MPRHTVPLCAALLFSLCATVPLAAQVATLPFRDEGDQRPHFARFRAGLLDAVTRRDTAYVIGILADDVLPGFGSNRGLEGFRRTWLGDEADRPPGARLWTVLEQVVRGGGVFTSDSTFVAPYTFAAFPDHLDAFEHGVVIGTGVRVRSEPGLGSSVVTHLSHAVVPVSDWSPKAVAGEEEWLPVELRDGRRGWMAARYLKSPLDYRAIFVHRNGRWLLRSLVAGD